MMGVNNTKQSPYPTLKRPATLDRLKAKPRPWRIVDIHRDPDALKALTAAEEALLQASMAIPSDTDAEERDARLATYRADVDQAKEAVEATTEQMLLGGVGRVQKRALLDLHPPRDEDHQAVKDVGAGDRAEYNADTYPCALIAASLIDPRLTAEEVAEITEGWTDNEFLLLWYAALEVNADASMVSSGKGRASNGTRD